MVYDYLFTSQRELDQLWANLPLHFHIVLKSLALYQGRQYLTKMVVSSAKSTILISWSSVCIPLIILLVLMKLASTSIAMMHNSLESRHPWQTRIIVKRSDRRPFILILDSILVYHVNQLSSCEWFCLHIQICTKQKR